MPAGSPRTRLARRGDLPPCPGRSRPLQRALTGFWRHPGAPGGCYDRAPAPAGLGSGMTKASTEATMAGGKVQWAVRGVAPDLQRRAVEVAAARGVTVGSLVTDALTAHLDALERGAEPVVVEAPLASVPTSP